MEREEELIEDYVLTQEQYLNILWNFKTKKCGKKCLRSDRRFCFDYHNDIVDRRRETRISEDGKLTCYQPWSYKDSECINVYENMFHPINYKTQKCGNFNRFGKCHFGILCSYRHIYRDVDYDRNFKSPSRFSNVKEKFLFLNLLFKVEPCKNSSHGREFDFECPKKHRREEISNTDRNHFLKDGKIDSLIEKLKSSSFLSVLCSKNLCRKDYCRFTHSLKEIDIIKNYKENLTKTQLLMDVKKYFEKELGQYCDEILNKEKDTKNTREAAKIYFQTDIKKSIESNVQKDVERDVRTIAQITAQNIIKTNVENNNNIEMGEKVWKKKESSKRKELSDEPNEEFLYSILRLLEYEPLDTEKDVIVKKENKKSENKKFVGYEGKCKQSYESETKYSKTSYFENSNFWNDDKFPKILF